MTDLRNDDELEAQIRRGLRDHVDGVEPSIDESWSAIEEEIVASSNHSARRPMLVAAAVVVIVVVVGAALVARRPNVDITAGPTAAASSLVALTAEGDLVEVGPDGSVGREIAKGPFHGPLSVSPVDGTIFVERYVRGDLCSSAYVTAEDVVGEIVAVPWAGGIPAVTVAHGTDPAISPDGRRLAYLAGPEDSCVMPPASRSLRAKDVASGRVEEHRGVRVVVTGLVGPPGWTDPQVLIGLFTRDHSCPAGAARSACTSTFLQAYDLRGLDAPPGATGSEPVPTDPPTSGATGYIGDLTEVPATESVATAGPGVLVTAGMSNDGGSIVIGRITIGGSFGDLTELARVGLASLGLTDVDRVFVSADPGSDRIAVSVTLTGGGTALLVGPPNELRVVSRALVTAAWSPAR